MRKIKTIMAEIPSIASFFTETRSDRLPELVAQIAPALRRLGLFGISLRLRLVIDSSTVIADLIWIVSKRKNPDARTSLEETICASVVIALAPPQIDAEIRGNLEDLSKQTGASTEVIWAAWLKYRTLLTIIEPQAVSTKATEYLQGRDASDVPFLHLSENLAAAAVVSSDPDLLAADKRRVVPPTSITIDLRNYARAKSIQLSIVGMGTITINIGLNMFVAAVQALPAVGRALAALPRWLHAVLIGLLIWALASSDRRSALVGFWTQVRAFVGDAVDGLKAPVQELMNTASEAHAKAEASRLSVMSKVHERPLQLRQAVHLALAQSVNALTAPQIEVAVRDIGYRSSAKSLRPSIIRALRADERFELTSRGWIARSESSPEPA